MAVRGRKTKSLDRSNYDSSQKRERRTGRAHSDSGANPRNQMNVILPSIDSVPVSEASIGGNILRNGPCGPGHDIYTKLLGPTADETILYGLQLFHSMGGQCQNPEDSEEEVETGSLSVVSTGLRKYDQTSYRLQVDVPILQTAVRTHRDYLMAPATEEDSVTVKVSSPSFSIETLPKVPTAEELISSSEPSYSEVLPQKIFQDVSTQTEKMEPEEMRDTVSVLSSLPQTDTDLKNSIVPEESKVSSRVETESTRESETRSKDQKISDTDTDTFSAGESLPPEKKSILKESSSSAKETSASVSCTCTCSVMVGCEQKKLEQNRRTVVGCCSCGGIKKSRCSLGKAKMKTCSTCCNRIPSCIRITETYQEKKKLCCDCYTSTSSTFSDCGNIKELEKGDCNQTVGKIKYAITKITDFGKFTTYEVMKSTRKKPKTMPVGLEGVFVLRRCQV